MVSSADDVIKTCSSTVRKDVSVEELTQIQLCTSADTVLRIPEAKLHTAYPVQAALSAHSLQAAFLTQHPRLSSILFINYLIAHCTAGSSVFVWDDNITVTSVLGSPCYFHCCSKIIATPKVGQKLTYLKLTDCSVRVH